MAKFLKPISTVREPNFRGGGLLQGLHLTKQAVMFGFTFYFRTASILLEFNGILQVMHIRYLYQKY